MLTFFAFAPASAQQQQKNTIIIAVEGQKVNNFMFIT